MRTLADYQGNAVRLTEERLAHIVEHPEMRGMEQAMAVALHAPDLVVRSRTDREVELYYHRQQRTPVGTELLCVVVKRQAADAFVITAYLTDRPKKGDILWTREP